MRPRQETTTETVLRAVLDSIRPRDLAPNERVDVIGCDPDMMSDDAALSFTVRYYRLDSAGRKRDMRSDKRSIHEHFMRRARFDKGVLVNMIVQEIRWALSIVRPPPPPPKNWRKFAASRKSSL